MQWNLFDYQTLPLIGLMKEFKEVGTEGLRWDWYSLFQGNGWICKCVWALWGHYNDLVPKMDSVFWGPVKEPKIPSSLCFSRRIIASKRTIFFTKPYKIGIFQLWWTWEKLRKYRSERLGISRSNGPIGHHPLCWFHFSS